MPIVVFERGSDKGKSIKLEAGKAQVFGRDPKVCSVVLNDTMTSRRHFAIESDGPVFRLRDLDSTNGTYLNDEKVTQSELKVGDKIQAGETILSFLSDQREETPQGLVGKVIGGYQIIERVGRGGMGTVYKAKQLSLNRDVALKVLSSRLLRDGKFIDRFKSEAQAAGKLNHPNIVQVYDVDIERNLHFFSMEFMGGGSLQDKIGKDGKLTWQEALDVLIQATRALIFAEKNKIVHRDVKPDNLMLTSDGQVKLLDLGLARNVDEAESAVDEGIFGTPHFISPEQAQGKTVDHRADLYSLGATAYRLLSGRTPFEGANVREIIQQQISAEPPPLRKLAPDTPEELAATVARLMRKNADERYASAADLLEDLEKIRLRYHLKVAGVGGGTRGVYIAVGLALVAVAALAVFILTRNDEPPRPNEEPTGTVIEPTTGTQQPEIIIREDLEAKAKAAYFEVNVEDARLGDLAETWESRGAEWRTLIDRYRRIHGEFPETEHGDMALARAGEIEKFLEAAQERDRRERDAARTAFESLEANITNALVEEKFATALDLARRGSADAKVKAARPLLPDKARQLDSWLGTGPGSIATRFAEAFAKAKERAEKLREAADYPGAVAALRDFLARAAGPSEESPFGEARKEAAEIAAQIRAEFESLLDDRLGLDAALFYRAYREIRHHAEDEAAFPAGNPVFDFRFGDAADRFAAILGDPASEGALTTEIYRERATQKVAQLRSAATLVTALVERVNEGTLASDVFDFPPDVVGGSGVTVELNREKNPVATMTGLEVVKRIRTGGSVGVSQEHVPWARFTAAALWRNVFQSGKRWPMVPEEHASAARFLAELAILDGLREEIAAAGEALASAERSWLHAEAAAMEAHRALLAARSTEPPDRWHVLAAEFVARHSATDFFVLVYGYPEIGERSLLPADREAAWKAGKLNSVQWP
ncbi:MAG: serine/threonine-protein kinase [Planctomycetes bacterium]|nr:serine/threonine-protein kinase [Planctomycetota bacterium]